MENDYDDDESASLMAEILGSYCNMLLKNFYHLKCQWLLKNVLKNAISWYLLQYVVCNYTHFCNTFDTIQLSPPNLMN